MLTIVDYYHQDTGSTGVIDPDTCWNIYRAFKKYGVLIKEKQAEAVWKMYSKERLGEGWSGIASRQTDEYLYYKLFPYFVELVEPAAVMADRIAIAARKL